MNHVIYYAYDDCRRMDYCKIVIQNVGQQLFKSHLKEKILLKNNTFYEWLRPFFYFNILS